MINIVDKDEFEKEISSGVVIADFFAEWCEPCKMLGPILEGLAVDMEGKVKFLKVDIDKNVEIANTYDIVSIPTMIILKDGKKQDVLTGFLPKNSIKDNIEKYLNKAEINMIYDYMIKDIKGTEISLNEYREKVLLIVKAEVPQAEEDTASKDLYEK